MTQLGDSGVIDVLVTSNARRGAEVFGRRLVDGLQRRGWDAELVSLRGGQEPGVESTVLVSELAHHLAPVPALRRRVRARHPQIVFANGGATLRTGVLATRFLRGGPRLLYGSIGEPSYWLRSRAHRQLQRLLITACAHVTAVSDATREGLVRELGVSPSKVTVIRPGVDGSWFDLPLGEDGRETLRVLFAGSLSREKDPVTAVRAVAGLGGAAVMRVTGDGPLRQELEGVDGVEVLGSVADMAAQFAWADVLLLTSRTEGLPGVAVEASAAGVPVVASRVGGAPEIVVDGETGLLVRPGDVDGFTAALERMQDPRQRHRMGEAARQRAADYFRIEGSIDAYDSLLREVLQR